MERRQLGSVFEVSALALGGAGLAQVWGSTSREEAVATVRAAYDSGITLFDVAPSYGDGEAERILGAAFADGYPDEVRIVTKCIVGPMPASAVRRHLEVSLTASLERLGLDRVHAYLLHGQVVPDDQVNTIHNSVALSTCLEEATTGLEALVSAGRAASWGFSALGPATEACAVIGASPTPRILQCPVNAMLSGPTLAPATQEPRTVLAKAVEFGVGVMGVQAVQRGALTDAIDRDVEPDSQVAKDFVRASGFRALAARLDCTPSYLAYRYALSVPNVGTIVLGVKNRAELEECLIAERDGRLDADLFRLTEESFRSGNGL